MTLACKLCRSRIPDLRSEVRCECGWRMDPRCCEHHEAFCPCHGEERWVGTLEI